MKIQIDNKCICELNDTKKKVLQNDIFTEEFESDIERRLEYIIMHKYEQSFKRLKDEWEPKLRAAGVKSFPADADEFAELVFAQPGYKSRSEREKEIKV